MVLEPDEFYGKFAERMAEQYKDEKLPDAFLALRDRFCDMVGSGRILDAGCGTGRDVDYFVQNGFDAVGIDAAEEMISYAREHNRGTYHELDMRKIPFDDAVFDGVWASAAIFFMPPDEMQTVLSEFHRVLTQDGILHVNFKQGDGEHRKERWGETVREYRVTQDDATALVEDAGFTVTDTTLNEGPTATFINVFGRK